MNKSKKVNFSVEKIRPITRKNRITGTQDDSDSDSDIGSDYEKPFSPPPSPPSYNPNESPIKPSIALLQKKASDFALRQIEKETYHPIVVVYDSRNPNGYYSPEYNDKFNQYLKQQDIKLNKSTSIAVLEDALINMFEDEFKKEVTACDFIRNVVFNKDKLLGDYSTYIQDWGSEGQRNYFYINVMLKDMPSDSDSQDSTDTVILGNNNIEKEMIEETEHTDDPHDGGSRKRKKTNKKKTNKKKTNKKRKTGKKRKTIRKRK
jgi:hypothetical protein